MAVELVDRAEEGIISGVVSVKRMDLFLCYERSMRKS